MTMNEVLNMKIDDMLLKEVLPLVTNAIYNIAFQILWVPLVLEEKTNECRLYKSKNQF